ncbi:DNA polymerase III subunit delta' [Candidatus Pantoea edessiphila]|uniref:DNA polymerase III subunit delta' n=1 Tax=Candidatus Pantoea edessiphila TaxID=2044610 RepID=A0A2P5SYY6_9GAMM|nr:DNA polymerase III subunit delta' C-terminal domain-containing protein [Candidatus Pantoea edessiphila]MBK4775354.1 DNA polymerase III subunit delta' [Pantoea sp. Edef]PPI87513.1 DNA polymerase III subunit delta' [Candidatus Pantoea edessiphila]
MEWYSWLDQPYLKIVNQYRQGFRHPVMLIQGIHGIAEDILIWKLSYWLLCHKPIDSNFCGICNSCRLMKINSHPDYYIFEARPKVNTVGIEIVKKIISNLYNYAHTGNKKIVSILNIEYLTQYASNALLKIIEEPPSDSWFFFSTQNFSKVPSTIRSRCIMFRLCPPSEAEAMLWVKTRSEHNELVVLSALRLSDGIPIKALDLITMHWNLRKKLYDALFVSLKHDILQLLPIMRENDIMCIHWLICLILDAMKLQNNIQESLINIDRKDVVILLSNYFSFSSLTNSIYNWNKCRNTLINTIGVNRELLLTNSLITWVEVSIFN